MYNSFHLKRDLLGKGWATKRVDIGAWRETAWSLLQQ